MKEKEVLKQLKEKIKKLRIKQKCPNCSNYLFQQDNNIWCPSIICDYEKERIYTKRRISTRTE